MNLGDYQAIAPKYIIRTSFEIEGVVEKSDVVGALFGQTEGLFGPEFDLRELQKTGRIGRIEVNVDTKSGKSQKKTGETGRNGMFTPGPSTKCF